MPIISAFPLVLLQVMVASVWTMGVAISRPCTLSTSSSASAGSNSTVGLWAFTITTSEPRLSNCSITALRAPSPMPMRLTTDATPIATPSTVRAERSLLDSMPWAAILAVNQPLRSSGRRRLFSITEAMARGLGVLIFFMT